MDLALSRKVEAEEDYISGREKERYYEEARRLWGWKGAWIPMRVLDRAECLDRVLKARGFGEECRRYMWNHADEMRHTYTLCLAYACAEGEKRPTELELCWFATSMNLREIDPRRRTPRAALKMTGCDREKSLEDIVKECEELSREDPRGWQKRVPVPWARIFLASRMVRDWKREERGS